MIWLLYPHTHRQPGGELLYPRTSGVLSLHFYLFACFLSVWFFFFPITLEIRLAHTAKLPLTTYLEILKLSTNTMLLTCFVAVTKA